MIELTAPTQSMLFGRRFITGKLLKITRPKKTFYFGITKEEGRHCWYRKIESEGYGGTWVMSINFFPRWKHRIVWRITQAWYHITNREYMLCQGCGEGVAKFRIRNPNHGHGNERYNCCEGCVTFYDWRWSAMDIIGWENKKPICKKGNRCIEVKRKR